MGGKDWNLLVKWSAKDVWVNNVKVAGLLVSGAVCEMLNRWYA